MSKRKKRREKRQARATSTSGIDGVVGQRENVLMSKDVDVAWLADEYRRRSSSERFLTLGIFADQYGVSVDELFDYIPELQSERGRFAILWHGTTKSRADSILKEGFNGRRRMIFFARSTRIPRVIAKARAAGEHDQPVLIRCSIDLNRYDNYRRQGRGVYAFSHDCIGSEVIQEVIGGHTKKSRERPTDVELTNITVNFNSGCAGIAYWINSCLKLEDGHRITEDHEAVVKIKEWLDTQADAGRFGEVSDEEMLVQVRKYLPSTVICIDGTEPGSDPTADDSRV